MNTIFKQIPLYRFLMYCNESALDRTVLDLGAGGNCPPLRLFSDYGYETHGIELSTRQLDQAAAFAADNGCNLHIEKGDMRDLPFENESFSFVYSYNSVFHMTKADVLRSINEMKRVLKPDGLLFVNFLTTKDFRCGQGGDIGQNQYEQMDEDVPVIHSYFEEGEADRYFSDMEILLKEDRVIERIYEGERIRQGFVDFIIRKQDRFVQPEC